MSRVVRAASPHLHRQERSIWHWDSTVEFYAHREGLQPAEKALFDRYLPQARSVLDLGVGGGRTTPFLAPGRRYVGVDIVPAMVDTCRAKYPTYEFRVGDAADLSWCPDRTFDLVVFSYNGLDYLYPDSARRETLSQVSRVLRPGGVFVFSRHDPWGGHGRRRFLRRVQLWRGFGYALDGGVQTTHYATRRHVTGELDRSGLRVVDSLPEGPGRRPAWWYYAATHA